MTAEKQASSKSEGRKVTYTQQLMQKKRQMMQKNHNDVQVLQEGMIIFSGYKGRKQSQVRTTGTSSTAHKTVLEHLQNPISDLKIAQPLDTIQQELALSPHDEYSAP